MYTSPEAKTVLLPTKLCASYLNGHEVLFLTLSKQSVLRSAWKVKEWSLLGLRSTCPLMISCLHETV